MRVTAILKGRIDKYGKQPIQIRIADKDKRSFKPTGLKVKPNEWSAERGLVKSIHTHSAAYNTHLRSLIVKYESGSFFKVVETNFFKYCIQCCNEWERTKKFTTISQYHSEMRKIKEFDSDFNLSDINTTWLNKYVAYCYSLGNKTNTVWKSIKFLKTVVRKAHKEGLIEKNPFDIFESPKYRNPPKSYLTQEQINKIDELQKGNVAPDIFLAATWFLISCYCGLRYGDCAAFDKEKHIKEGRLVVYTGKTGEVISMPISERLRAYFEAVNYQPLHYTNQAANRLLKAIGATVGIEGLSWHTGRHTFGTLALSNKISIEVVSKLMGHRDVKTTAIYAKITNRLIDEEMNKLK